MSKENIERQSAWSRRMTLGEQWIITRRIFGFTKRYAGLFILAIFLSVIVVGIGVTLPRIIQTFIDHELATNRLTMQSAFFFMALYGGLLIAQAITNFFTTYLFNLASERTVESIRNTIFKKINTLGMRFYDQTPAGSIVSRVTNDTETLKQFWGTFFALFEGIVSIVSVFVGMYILNPTMSLMFLIFIPIMIILIWYYQAISTTVYRQMRENLSRLNTMINESISGMATIQHFHQEKRTYKRFSKQNDRHYENHRAMVRMNATLLMPAINFLEGISLALVIYVLGRQFFDGFVEVGMIYAFTQYSGQFFRPMGMMMDSMSLLQDGLVSSSRILRYLDYTEYVPEQTPNPEADITEAKVEFKNLTFSYDGKHDVLKNISFTVQPGETVAIVGHTGSGKSSIINVLMRFYEFQSGDVLIDGYSIRDFTYDQLRSDVGLVLQDSFLFYGDIARNIRLLDQTINDDEIQDAARFVSADSFIEAYPDHYRHKVIERGASFSSGEKQLISFARTMVRDPKLLILDEATANIDTETEEHIQDSLAKMRHGRTTIAIAHRLSTIKDANEIIVLDQGEIIEKGNHDELIAKQGAYYQMYRLQTMNN